MESVDLMFELVHILREFVDLSLQVLNDGFQLVDLLSLFSVDLLQVFVLFLQSSVFVAQTSDVIFEFLDLGKEILVLSESLQSGVRCL